MSDQDLKKQNISKARRCEFFLTREKTSSTATTFMPTQAITAARVLFERHLFGLVLNDLNHRFDERFFVSQVPLRCRVQEWTCQLCSVADKKHQIGIDQC